MKNEAYLDNNPIYNFPLEKVYYTSKLISKYETAMIGTSPLKMKIKVNPDITILARSIYTLPEWIASVGGFIFLLYLFGKLT